MSRLKSILENNRAVSPVIGVILMVAITVILAAVIGTFVLGLGDSLEQTPQAQLDAEGGAAGNEVAGSSTEEIIGINHNGGDKIPADEIKIRLQVPGGTSWTTLWDGSSSTTNDVSYTDGDGDSVAVGFNSNPSDLSVGNSLSVPGDAASTNPVTVTGEWDIQIVHIESDSILLDTTVDI